MEAKAEPNPPEEETPATPAPEAPPANDKETETEKDRLMRALADAENAKKRIEREKEDIAKYAVASLARDILTVADNLHRALLAVTAKDKEADPHLKNLSIGVEATERELQSTLERHGLKKVEPLGQSFDYNFHQAISEIETTEKPPGTVMQVLQAGYTLNERLLRPALVIIAKAPVKPGDVPPVDVKA
ncbi:MAG: nucleotide exchange factor GrpE [Dongiaceae bacterium]